MIVLGIDPGTATTGYGVVAYQAGREKLIEYGTITTPADMEMAHRLLLINQDLNELIQVFKPDAIAIEQIFFHKNSKTVITVAQARGVAMLTAARNGITLDFPTLLLYPGTWHWSGTIWLYRRDLYQDSLQSVFERH